MMKGMGPRRKGASTADCKKDTRKGSSSEIKSASTKREGGEILWVTYHILG